MYPAFHQSDVEPLLLFCQNCVWYGLHAVHGVGFVVKFGLTDAPVAIGSIRLRFVEAGYGDDVVHGLFLVALQNYRFK